MSPTQLLRGIQRSGLPTNSVRVLLAVASGARRHRDILRGTELSEYCVRGILDRMTAEGWIARESIPASKGGGSGRVSCYSLTAEGVLQAQRIFQLAEQPTAPTAYRAGFPVGIRVTSGRGISFL